ncbi:MAG TPA: hypothetical protein VFK45_01980 [Gammaproteobacteria bacterium]|nr:hypothetical protein [Gammaproteobacteria bacterium]
MKRYTQLIGVSLLALSVAGLGGCFGNGDDGTTMTPTPTPQPQPEPQPEPQPKPESVAFTDFVHAQFADDVRKSDTAAPVDVSSIDFTFADTPDPHAYDDLLAGASADGGSGS